MHNCLLSLHCILIVFMKVWAIYSHSAMSFLLAVENVTPPFKLWKIKLNVPEEDLSAPPDQSSVSAALTFLQMVNE